MTMPDREMLTLILQKAVEAPSGDNSQPWEFMILPDRLEIRNVERDATIYNFRQRGSFLSHGALVENITLLSAAAGYMTSVEPFPQGCDCTAHLTFENSDVVPVSELVNEIQKRTTNRKPYVARVLSANEREVLEAGAHAISSVHLGWITERSQIEQLAPVIAQNERLLFEHRGLHDFLFSMIRWNKREEKEKPGLYVMTMEFPAPLRLLIKYVFSHWALVRLANALSLSRAISGDSAKLYATSSAFCAVIIDGYDATDFFRAGRALERVWLQATGLGMSIQPVTALPYLLQRVREGEAAMFSAEQVSMIKKAGETIEGAFAVTHPSHIAMLFRIGYAQPPTAHSRKLSPIIH